MLQERQLADVPASLGITESSAFGSICRVSRASDTDGKLDRRTMIHFRLSLSPSRQSSDCGASRSLSNV